MDSLSLLFHLASLSARLHILARSVRLFVSSGFNFRGQEAESKSCHALTHQLFLNAGMTVLAIHQEGTCSTQKHYAVH